MIEIKNISHSLGGKKILENVNLTVNEGSVLGLVGINGAGKSTLLRIASGVYIPEEGEVLYDGASVFLESTRREIFFLPDDPYYTLHTTGKNIFEMYRVFYPDMKKADFAKYLAIYGIDEKKPIRNFSKGMRRQLFIALALAVKPKYLLLDEAFDGLDPLSRLTFKKAINEFVEENGATVIISSHSLRELEDFCDCYALIDKQTVASSGDIADEVNKLCKFQIAFTEDKTEDIFAGLPTVKIEKNGRFFRVILEGDSEEMAEKLNLLSPAVIDEMPVDFEELFISEVEHRGYTK
ncbi:MAG: ABC transporter ATP-binding protein [Clostridia bacterium]|nr:ABC transporter ATP-binding protein [Clostridia bacterium]